MRIALITREYLPETSWGGIGTFYRNFASDLCAAGHDVEVFTQALQPGSDRNCGGIKVHAVLPRFYMLGAPRGGEMGGMLAPHIGIFAMALALAIRDSWRTRHFTSPFDVVEAHEHLGIGSFLGRDLPGVVQVQRYHVAYDLLVRRGLEAWPRSWLVRRLECRSLRHADLRIATTHFIDEATQRTFPRVPPADSIIPIANGLSEADYGNTAEKERVIVFAGRLTEVKQPTMMARAFARVSRVTPDWRLEIAGADTTTPRGNTYWSEMKSLLGDAAARCHYWGLVDRSQLFEIFRRASIIAVPSAFESFGLAALEAMSFGCVPVVSNRTALPEITAGVGIVFDNGNEDEFVAALLRLTQSPAAELQLRSQHAIERSKNAFTPVAITKRNLDVFERAIHRKRAALNG